MPGPAKKKDAERRNKPAVTDLRLVKGDGIDPGEPDPEWSPAVAGWWADFWSQRELLLGLGSIDVHLVRRIAGLKQLREEAAAGLKGNPLVMGSQGQPVANPLSRLVLSYDAEIRQLEDRLGLSPRARLNLGVSIAQASKRIEDLFPPAAEGGAKVIDV